MAVTEDQVRQMFGQLQAVIGQDYDNKFDNFSKQATSQVLAANQDIVSLRGEVEKVVGKIESNLIEKQQTIADQQQKMIDLIGARS